ncbi:MAG TPA: glycosyl hydrolase family 28-related protein [Ktedonobacterales bacterium]|nr:glycosyl hydrolase family 28-related protein [Ktedonobacterales bacterium]
MSADQFTNNGISTLAGGGSGPGGALLPGDTTAVVMAGTGALFPATSAGTFRAVLLNTANLPEVVICTARSTDTLTLTRAQENTTAPTSWPLGTTILHDVTAGNMANLWNRIAGTVINVRDYGAVGNGIADDAPAFRAAAAALLTAGGGTLYVPAGTYLLNSTIANPTYATIASECFWLPTGTTLQGAGPTNTILKLGAGLPNQTYLATNYRPSGGGGDEDICLRDVTLDGNAANNNGALIDAMYGVALDRVRRASFRGVVTRNFYGTTSGGNGPNGSNGESYQIGVTACLDVSIVACHTYCNTSQIGSGCAVNQSTNIGISDSIFERSTLGQGLACSQSQNIAVSNCQGYLCGYNGLNFEFCTNVRLSGCTGGGQMSSYTPSGLWYAASASLGNTHNGISFLSSVNVYAYGCEGSYNGVNGFQHYGTGAGQARVHGGNFSNNSANGIYLDASSKHLLEITGRPIVVTNTTAAVQTGDTTVASMTAIEGSQTAPTMPATGVGITNPFPCVMVVRISGGTMTSTQIGPQGGSGASMLGANEGRLLVPPNWFITPNYSVTPTWQWMAEPI